MANVTGVINISKGNSKTGAIPSFSLPSGRTCSKEACETCYREGCYARKLERLRPTVRESYAHNLNTVTFYPDDTEQQLNAYFDMPNATRLFRIHVSGDFFSADYFEMWLRVIEKHPGTQFLAFTKQAKIIAPYLHRLPQIFLLFGAHGLEQTSRNPFRMCCPLPGCRTRPRIASPRMPWSAPETAKPAVAAGH